MKELYILEYPIKSSMRILFSRLSTPIGLSEWFADDVKLEDSIFVFRWKKHTQKAKMLRIKDQHSVCFQWLDDEAHNDDDYFEFKISQGELTGEVILTIRDFAEPEDLEDSKNLWEAQINKLKRLLGSE